MTGRSVLSCTICARDCADQETKSAYLYLDTPTTLLYPLFTHPPIYCCVLYCGWNLDLFPRPFSITEFLLMFCSHHSGKGGGNVMTMIERFKIPDFSKLYHANCLRIPRLLGMAAAADKRRSRWAGTNLHHNRLYIYSSIILYFVSECG